MKDQVPARKADSWGCPQRRVHEVRPGRNYEEDQALPRKTRALLPYSEENRVLLVRRCLERDRQRFLSTRRERRLTEVPENKPEKSDRDVAEDEEEGWGSVRSARGLSGVGRRLPDLSDSHEEKKKRINVPHFLRLLGMRPMWRARIPENNSWVESATNWGKAYYQCACKEEKKTREERDGDAITRPRQAPLKGPRM